MSSSINTLPPYQEKPSSTNGINRLGGTIQTCSIKDGQIDYFSIIRVSETSYYLSLTVDPTPLYRIELILGPNKLGNIQIFSTSSSKLLAAVRVSTDQKSKSQPIGTICTSSPSDPDAVWRPIALEKGFLAVDYETHIPVVIVPGRAAKSQSFLWKIDEGKGGRLCWERPLHNSINPTVNDLNFATISIEDDGETLVEMRRGGGIDFELSVILEAFLLMDLTPKTKLA
ncbi:unnamed protein product [Clonostachys byssicola]|uniref:Uncharacterized protein n=1 Tax=Clonostachys byssicola TaxID=160290 RepID=A0A9N9XZA4_9HYPO|nr:unnamed protein product [Clonostachys byssicola]